MKVAITGASSTGKTTLINYLLLEPNWPTEPRRFLTTDARRLLVTLGHHAMDVMTPDETRVFQRAYFKLKREVEEGVESFITDRSFVDVAAYWVVRDAAELGREAQDELVLPCREEAKKYDFHVFLPFGGVPFMPDGYRPTDTKFNQAVDRQIRFFLEEWGLRYRVVETSDLSERVALVTNWVRGLA